MTTSGEAARLGTAVARIASDLGRARGLLGDAMAQLFTTFQRLREHLAEERVRYECAILSITGSASNTGLVAIVRDVLDRFVADIIQLSRSSVRILLEVETLRGHAETVASRGLRIERIAQTTRVISLNARIEAQRFGANGAVFRVVADEIKALANESGELSQAIRRALDEQAASLEATGTAAEALAATDLDSAVSSHKEIEATIARLADVSATSTQALGVIQADIDRAIEALQFEDMLDQLLGAIANKLASVQRSCESLGRGGSIVDLGEVERDAVTQRDVSTGSVELF